MASICRRRKYSRCCFWVARLHLVADALADPQLGQAVLLEPQGEGQPLDHVQGLEQLQLLVEVEVRRVAGGVGQRARDG